MTGIGEASSIISVIQISEEVLKYVRTVKDASQERKRLLREASSLMGQLTTLQNVIQDGDFEADWQHAVKQLTIEDGPLDQYKAALETLAKRLKPAHGVRKAGQVIAWPLFKDEVSAALGQIHRLQSLTQVALDMDHL